MVVDAEPLEILLHQALHSEDEVSEDSYDTEYYVNRRKELILMERVLSLVTITTVVVAAAAIFFGVKVPIPFDYTHGVFGNHLLTVAIVLYIVAFGYAALEYWWNTTRLVED